MKIGLINPNRNSKDAAIHLGLGYLASYARQNHFDLEFNLLDTKIAKTKDFEAFFSQSYKLFAFTANSQCFEEAVEMAEKLKHSYPESLLCISGSYASSVKEKCLSNHPFDFAIYGEEEETFSELIDYVKGEKILESIKGLIYRDESGLIHINLPRPLITKIDQIPFPAYDLFQMKRYSRYDLLSNRGCPENYLYCSSSLVWTKRMRMRSIENILAEIKFLIKHYGKRNIYFDDECFNTNFKRVIEFCRLLVDKKLGIKWSCAIDIDSISSEIADLMKQAGCQNIRLAIESANDEVLKKLDKNTSIEKIQKGIKIFRKAGITVMGQFMIGNPGDTLESVKETIYFAKNSDLSQVEFYVPIPYRETELWEYIEENGKFLTKTEPYTFYNISPLIIFETPEFSYKEQLEAIELAAKNGFYHALTQDERNFTITKIAAPTLQKLMKNKSGNKLYLGLKKVYKKMK